MNFRDSTAVESLGSGSFRAEIHPGWDIAGHANGGYMMAIAARAMAEASRPQPVALTAHFLSPGNPGSVKIDTAVSRVGRRFTTLRATLSDENRTLVELLGSFADGDDLDTTTRVEAKPPELPPPDQCVRLQPSPNGFPPPLMGKIDLRLHPEDAMFAAGRPTGRPEFRGWFRLGEDEPVGPFALLLAVDVFPPTVFNANLPIAWTPTLELSAHVRCAPAPGWLRCRFSTRFITGGMLEEDGEVWDERDRLVAQSRQLALLPRARSGAGK